jgi:hypothetical protein
MADDLGDADNGEVLGIDDNLAASRAHALSAGAEELEPWTTPPQRLNQLRAIHFARSFAC